MEYIPLYLAGRCHDGRQQDGGYRWHAVVGWKALCGAEPGRRSAGWAPWEPRTEEEKNHEVTCPRCKKAIEAQKR